MTVPSNGRLVDFYQWASDITKHAIACNAAAHMQRAFSLVDFDAQGRCINLGQIQY